MHFLINFRKINIIIAFCGLSLWGAENKLFYKYKDELAKKNRLCMVFKKSKEVIEMQNPSLSCFNLNLGNKFYITPNNIDIFIKKFKGSEEERYLKQSKNIVFSIQTINDLYEAAKKVEFNEEIYLASTDLYELSKTTNMYFFYFFLKDNFIANNCIFKKDELHQLHEHCFDSYLLPLLKEKDIPEEYIFLSEIIKKNGHTAIIDTDHDLNNKSENILDNHNHLILPDTVEIKKDDFITIIINDCSLQVALQDFLFLKIKNNKFNFEEALMQEFIDTFQNTTEGLYVQKYKKEIFSYACLVSIGTILEKINTKSLLVNSTNKNAVLTMIDVYFLTHFLLFQDALDTHSVPYGGIHCFADTVLTNCYLPCLEKEEVKEHIYNYHDIINY